MKRISASDLLVYAVVGQGLREKGDILLAILPFLEPIVAEQKGGLFDAKKFAGRVNELYQWGYNTDIVEELIPRFISAGWLRALGASARADAFEVLPDQFEGSQLKVNVRKAFSEISELFYDFVSKLSHLGSVAYTVEELEELLLNWLVYYQAYDKEAIESAAYRLLAESKDVCLIDEDVSSIRIEDSYICARFIKSLQATNEHLFDCIVDVASASMLTEVVRDFHRPKFSERDAANLTVFLDAPIIMDYLGLSGLVAQGNARTIIDTFRKMGARVAAFRHCCEEVKDNLRAVLEAPPSNRFGPTAEALRHREVLEDFARAIRSDIEHHLGESHIHLVEDTIEHYPHQAHYFSHDLVQDMQSAIRWHENHKARARDATSVALVMRKRAGAKSSNIFRVKSVMISSNPLLAEVSRKFCVDNDLIFEGHIGPIVHQRRVAAMLWLTVGSAEAQELPRRQLLTACEAVLNTRPQVIRKAKEVLRGVDEGMMPQLEALLTQPRSTQLLMDMTLGVDRVLKPENISEVLEQMRRSLAEEAEEAAALRIAAEAQKAHQEIEALKGGVDSLGRQNQFMRDQLIAATNYDKRMLESWMQTIIEKEARWVARQKWFWTVMAAFPLAVGLALYHFGQATFNQAAGFSIPISLLIVFIANVLRIWDRYPNTLKRHLEEKRAKDIAKKALEAGRRDLLGLYKLDWTKISATPLTEAISTAEGILKMHEAEENAPLEVK